MSLFEWIGEAADPGEVGEVRFDGPEDRPPRSRVEVAVRLVLAAMMLAGLVWLLAWFGLRTLEQWAIAAGVTAGYLFVGYFVRPEPDWDNIGWFGGMMNHPFRYTDNINRTLLTFKLILWPGAFLSESIVDLPILLGGGDRTGPRLRKRRRSEDGAGPRRSVGPEDDAVGVFSDPPPAPRRFKPKRTRAEAEPRDAGADVPLDRDVRRRRDRPEDERSMGDRLEESRPTDQGTDSTFVPTRKRRRPGSDQRSDPGGSVFEPRRED